MLYPSSPSGQGTCGCAGMCICDISPLSSLPYTGELCQCSPDTDSCEDPSDIGNVCFEIAVKVSSVKHLIQFGFFNRDFVMVLVNVSVINVCVKMALLETSVNFVILRV